MQSLKQIVRDVNTEKNRIYSSIALFLMVISVFVMFAIRPVLVIAFELVQKEKELIALNYKLEEVISQITSIQTALQQVENRLDILSIAMPDKPNINTMIGDIQRSAIEHNITVSKITGSDITLIKKNTSAQSYVIDMQSSGNFEDMFAFQQSLYRQRRLKGIQKIDILKNTQTVASDAAQLRFAVEIVGYYL